MSYTSVFGGTTIYPSDVSYLPLALAVNTTLEWPLEASGDVAVAARIIGVTPASAGLSVIMPDATRTGTGQSVLFNNMGATHSFTVKDDAGTVLATVAVGTQWQIYLTDNTTAAGTWEVYQMGASTATVQASALAGPGLMVVGSQLAQAALFTQFTTNLSPTAANRATMYVYTGTGAATLTLPTASTVDNKFFIRVRNQGTGVVLIDPSGTDLINGVTGLNLAPEDSAMIICDGAANWYTVGLGQNAEFTFDFTSIPVGGGTYTLSGAQLNRIAYRFTGTLNSDQTIIVPDTVQQYWVDNRTTGSFTLGLKTAAQASPTLVNQNASAIMYCDGTEVVLADTSTLSLPVAVAQGGTGATTPSGARTNLGITPFGNQLVTALNSTAAQTVLFPNPITDGQMLIGNAATPGFAQTTLTAGTGIGILNGPGSVTITNTGSPAPGSVYSQLFSGTGSQTAFTLAYQPYSEDNTQVYINGVYQQKNTYSLSGFTLTFSTAPVLGTNNIEVIVIQVVPIGATTANLVSFAPTGGLTSTNVQSAIVEVVTDLAATGAGQGDALVGQSNGNTVRQNSPLTIWRRLPSLVGGGVAGTPAQNAARLQTQINTLSAAGGGILQLVEDQIDIDQSLVVPEKVSIIGPGTGRALLRNTFASTYAQAQVDVFRSPVLQTGNFSTGYANALWGNSNSKTLNAVAAGDGAVTLTTPGDAAGYAVGDTVIFFSDARYNPAAGQSIAHYMTIRKITKISGAILYLDWPLTEAFAVGYAYNLRTGTLPGAPRNNTAAAQPFYVWGDAEIAGFDVDTVWHWKAGDAGCYAGYFSDIFVQQSRTVAYGNFHVNCVFDNVSGRFTQVFSELAENSEQNIVRNFRASYDEAARVASSTPAFFAAITAAENSLDNTFEDGFVDCGIGSGASNPVIKQNNAERVTVRSVNFIGASTFAGNVLDIGNNATVPNRREALNGDYDISWNGGCRRYLSLSNALTAGNVINGEFRGLPTVQGAVVNAVLGQNTIQSTTFMEQGSLGFNSTTANLSCNGAYIGGGVAALATTDYSFLVANDIRNIRTANTVARRRATTSRAATYTATTSETDVLSANIGTATLQRQDAIAFSCNVALTGVAGNKTVRFKVADTTTPTTYTVLEFVIANTTAGTVTINGTINLTSPSAIYAEASVRDPAGTATATTVTNTPITADLSAKAITLSITAIRASAGDAMTIPAARIALTNPVQV